MAEYTRATATGELVARMSGQVARLVRAETRLAQVELRQKGRNTGIGAGLAGAGAVLVAGPLAFLGRRQARRGARPFRSKRSPASSGTPEL